MKIKKMSKDEFAKLADEYINNSGATSISYYRWTLLVQAALEDPEICSKLDKFDWSDSEWDAIGEQGDELNYINGVPFILGYTGDGSDLVIFIIYHDGDRFQIYLGENADTHILKMHPEEQENFILMYVAKFINNWQIV